jgi:hypothetical protein
MQQAIDAALEIIDSVSRSDMLLEISNKLSSHQEEKWAKQVKDLVPE